MEAHVLLFVWMLLTNIKVGLTEEEREENIRLLEEIVEAEFPLEEMTDPTFRDKVLVLQD